MNRLRAYWAAVVRSGPPAVVQLRPGLNAFSFKQSLEAVQRSYTYQAVFQPLESVTESGEVVHGLAGDRVQNNSASTHVVALGRRRVLFVEARDKAGEHDHLIQRLQAAGESKFQVTDVTSDLLPLGKTDLGVFLSNFDCVVLANVPADQFLIMIVVKVAIIFHHAVVRLLRLTEANVQHVRCFVVVDPSMMCW